MYKGLAQYDHCYWVDTNFFTIFTFEGLFKNHHTPTLRHKDTEENHRKIWREIYRFLYELHVWESRVKNPLFYLAELTVSSLVGSVLSATFSFVFARLACR